MDVKTLLVMHMLGVEFLHKEFFVAYEWEPCLNAYNHLPVPFFFFFKDKFSGQNLCSKTVWF